MGCDGVVVGDVTLADKYTCRGIDFKAGRYSALRPIMRLQEAGDDFDKGLKLLAADVMPRAADVRYIHPRPIMENILELLQNKDKSV